MPEVTDRIITALDVRNAVNLVIFAQGATTVEELEPPCAHTNVCGVDACHFPRYSRNGAPAGLLGHTLIQLGYPLQVLLELDREHLLGEIIHPGVKLGRSRNPALARIDNPGMTLLSFLQEKVKLGHSYADLALAAFGPRWTPKILDRRSRPWLY